MLLTDLPTELLDQILMYLDWHLTGDLVPERTDLLSCSLVCKTLRACAAPLLFKTVTLSLRWANAVLLEPRLVKLRRFPHLIRHVRRVHIQTHFRSERRTAREHYTIPSSDDDWLDPTSMSTALGASTELWYRHHIHKIARQLYADRGWQDDGSTAEKMVSKLIGLSENTLSFQDGSIALSIVMLCFPVAVEGIIFDSMPRGPKHSQQSVFALLVLSAAVQVFGGRIRELTMMDDPSCLTAVIPARPLSSGEDMPITDARTILTAELVQMHLSSIVRLRLETSAHPRAPSIHNHINPDPAMNPSLDRWRPLCATLHQLELYSVGADMDTLVQYLGSFKALKRLGLRDLVISRDGRRVPDHGLWLTFAISLRRVLPSTHFRMEKLHSIGSELSDSALDWLLGQAIPIGASIGLERETRLREDFEAFQILWQAEGSGGGKQARNEWDEPALEASRAKLVDKAMASRWKGH